MRKRNRKALWSEFQFWMRVLRPCQVTWVSSQEKNLFAIVRRIYRKTNGRGRHWDEAVAIVKRLGRVA
jgi:hypothetical protein